MTKQTTDSTFSSDVLNSKLPVLVDFYADWCGPCKQLTPIIEQLALDYQGQIEVYKCNVDNNPETPAKYAVRGIPSLMLFKEGKLVDTKVGALPKASLIAWINQAIQ